MQRWAEGRRDLRHAEYPTEWQCLILSSISCIWMSCKLKRFDSQKKKHLWDIIRLTWRNKKTQFHRSREPKCREKQKESMCCLWSWPWHCHFLQFVLSDLSVLFSLSLSLSTRLSPVLKTSSRTGLRSAAGVPKQTHGAQRECGVSQRDSLDPCGVYSRKPPVTFRYDTSRNHTFPLKSSQVFSVTH